jgi:hypothetical protein
MVAGFSRAVDVDRTAEHEARSEGRAGIGFGSGFTSLSLWRLRSGPPISVVGWVKEGGSLAGNESSSSRLRSFSCSLCDSFFVFAAFSLVVDLLVSARVQLAFDRQFDERRSCLSVPSA